MRLVTLPIFIEDQLWGVSFTHSFSFFFISQSTAPFVWIALRLFFLYQCNVTFLYFTPLIVNSYLLSVFGWSEFWVDVFHCPLLHNNYCRKLKLFRELGLSSAMIGSIIFFRDKNVEIIFVFDEPEKPNS